MASKGKRLVLDRQHMIQMVADPDFFKQCPHFLWLRNTATQTFNRYEENRKQSCCGGDFRIMQPVIDALFRNLKELYSVDPDATDRVRKYLEGKKGYAISQVVIYYRATKKQKHPAKLTIKGGARDGSQSQPPNQDHVEH